MDRRDFGAGLSKTLRDSPTMLVGESTTRRPESNCATRPVRFHKREVHPGFSDGVIRRLVCISNSCATSVLCARHPEWKVVCKVVVRGRRGEREFESSQSADILSIGHHASFEGLSALPSEGQPGSSTNARVPAVDVVVDMAIAEEGTDFISEGETRMLGDSSADE